MPKDFTAESVRLDSLVALMDSRSHNQPAKIEVDSPFLFNPNMVLFNELKMLGFEEETANKLIRYRERGGRYVVKADLLKIYGMDSTFFKQIYPYIDLPIIKESVKPLRRQFAKNIPDSLFDLNLVDSVKLLDVYGIGPVLSSRVVRYRAKLGGFVSKNQLHEVYGLDSMVVKRLSDLSFISQSFVPQKINLNTFTENQLSSHPYLSRSDASAIVAYRFQHGPFQSLEDIRNIQSIDKKTFIKIESYLTVDP